MVTHQLARPIESRRCMSASGETLDSVKRALCVGLGVFFVAIGFVGAFLPGIPTTGPLIAASFLLAKGSPRLRRRLLASRVFSKYAPYLDSSRAIPLRARICAMACMWTSILASCFLMMQSGQFALPAVAAIVAMGLLGTPVILLFRRAKSRRAPNARVSTVSPLELVEMQLRSPSCGI